MIQNLTIATATEIQVFPSLAKEDGAMDKISSTHRQQLLIRILLAIDG
jgi:hypothetical protein